MIRGSCLCGKVKYEYDGEIEEIAMCHCSQCRKAQGGAFGTNSPVKTALLKFTGSENIREFKSSPNKVRAFCQHCGSPLYSALEDLAGVCRLRLGTVDTEFTCDNKYHICVASKAPWQTIDDEFPQFSHKPGT